MLHRALDYRRIDRLGTSPLGPPTGQLPVIPGFGPPAPGARYARTHLSRLNPRRSVLFPGRKHATRMRQTR